MFAVVCPFVCRCSSLKRFATASAREAARQKYISAVKKFCARPEVVAHHRACADLRADAVAEARFKSLLDPGDVTVDDS